MPAKKVKLLVQVSECCSEILRYIDHNINRINGELNTFIEIVKIPEEEFDEELVERLRLKGITRLPALIAPDGTPYCGIKRIQELFEGGLNTRRKDEFARPVGNAELGTNPDLADFYARELYAGTKNGRPIPRKDKGERNLDGEDGENDLDRKMREYNSNIPKHRRQTPVKMIGQFGDEDEQEERPRARRRERVRDDDEDNIAESPPPRQRQTANSRQYGNGDDMDEAMLNAFLDKNGGD